MATSNQANRTQVSEASFLRTCGLDVENDADRALFDAMKAHASASVDGMLASLNNMNAANITEAAIRREIRTIIEEAGVEATAIYDKAQAGPEGEDNWIVRWLLWNELNRRGIHF